MKLVNTHILSLLLISYTGVYHAQEWSLKQCLDSAQVHNKTLRIQHNQHEIAVQKQKEASGQLIPKLSLNADYKYFTDLPYQLMPLSVFGGPEGQFKEAQFGVPHHINANVQLIAPVYNSQVMGGIKTSKIGVELSELIYQKTQEEVFFEISNLYYNVQLLIKQLSFINHNLDNNELLLETVRLLHTQQLARKVDVDKVLLQRQQLQTQQALVESKLNQLLNGLKLAIGQPLDSPLTVQTEITTPPLTTYTLQPNSDFLIAKKQFELRQSELRTLKFSRMPSVSLFATYGTNGFGFDQQPNRFLNFYPIGFAGIQFSYPLFNGTITTRKINQKKLEVENNSIQLTYAQEQQEMHVTNLLIQRSVVLKTSEWHQEQLNLAAAIYDQTLVLQREGLATINDVLLADSSIKEHQQTYISGLIDLLRIELELRKLSGNFKH